MFSVSLIGVCTWILFPLANGLKVIYPVDDDTASNAADMRCRLSFLSEYIWIALLNNELLKQMHIKTKLNKQHVFPRGFALDICFCSDKTIVLVNLKSRFLNS